jgi:ketosteroid isomerase-like protein
MQFEAEFRSALTLAADSLDLSGPQAVLKHWQAVAMMAANPLTDEEREQLERAKAGDFSGLITMRRDEDGNWVSG